MPAAGEQALFNFFSRKAPSKLHGALAANKQPLARNAGAQTPMETIGISIVLVGLLLLVFATTYARNAETGIALETAENNIECSGLSTAIARLYSNRATTSETVSLNSDALLRRVEGNPGGINVGEVSCNYIGSVEMEGGERDSDPGGTGTAGITLSIGQWCLEKSQGTGIAASLGECE
jgi:hypothetical protein